jgi:signal transduction histidine kinase/DNA-binding response OmpR family regulator
MNNNVHLPTASEPIVSDADRKRIASGVRLTVALMVMVVLIVSSLTMLIFVLVSRIFDSVTPSVAADLAWKAQRGAIELSKTAEFGLVTHDASLVRRSATDYLSSTEVVNVLAVDPTDGVVFAHGAGSDEVAKVFLLPALEVHSLGGRLVAWAPAAIEEAPVGKVAVAVSTSRLEAGNELRRQILTAAVLGGLVAMLMSALFVTFYIAPILRVTQEAFVRLEHTTRAALEAARLKAQFLANMSHEIRTPMNAVVGLSKLMLGMPLGPKLRRYAEMIDASSRALLSIINDILDFSKIEAGKYEIVGAPMEPALLVQEVAELLADRAQSKGIDLVYRIAPEVPRVVEADADRVRQVLMNLVGNAVKFTERGEVYVQLLARAAADGQVELRFEVHDSGIGVPQESQDHIFEAFSQADGSLVRKHGGTGLGLTISKQLVHLMGGTLGLDSEVGKGSCFWFSLPLRVIDASSAVRAQPTSLGKRTLIVCDNVRAATGIREHAMAWGMDACVASSAAEAKQLLRESLEVGPRFDIAVVSETHSGTQGQEVTAELREVGGRLCPPVVLLLQHGDSSTRGEMEREIAAQLAQPVRMSELYECLARILVPGSIRPARRSARPAHAARGFAGARVLVVDDNEMNQFVAVEQLRRLGCTVDQAFNGKEAAEKVLAHEYALVLMDCQMPVMDGYAATREIRTREQGRRTVIVALTAHALQGERDRVLSAGMDDYLTKPVRPVTLQRTLERWISQGGPAPTSPEDAVDQAAVVDHGEPENDVEYGLQECATELLMLLLDKVPQQLELLDGALALGEVMETREHAHKLKGSLLTVSAGALANYAEQLQHMAEAGDLNDADGVYAELLAGYRELERSVKQELSRRARAERGASVG